MRAVNHRFCSLIERIVHGRLLVAASLRDWKLIVECYHPSSQYSEPYVFCEYLGTPSLGNDAALQLSMSSSLTGELREGLKGLLARFRPTLKTPETRITRPYPPEDNCGQPRTELPSLARSSEEEAVKRRVNLDSHENFSQLMFNASLVRIGPRKGVFLALADVLERKTMRIFRDWLARKAHGTLRGVTPSLDVSPNERPRADNGDERASELIWVDEGSKIAGLEVEVRELRWRREMPILVSRDEDQAVSYSLELKGTSSSITTYSWFVVDAPQSCVLALYTFCWRWKGKCWRPTVILEEP